MLTYLNQEYTESLTSLVLLCSTPAARLHPTHASQLKHVVAKTRTGAAGLYPLLKVTEKEDTKIESRLKTETAVRGVETNSETRRQILSLCQIQERFFMRRGKISQVRQSNTGTYRSAEVSQGFFLYTRSMVFSYNYYYFPIFCLCLSIYIFLPKIMIA